jgi:HEPN domain-containing protein
LSGRRKILDEFIDGFVTHTLGELREVIQDDYDSPGENRKLIEELRYDRASQRYSATHQEIAEVFSDAWFNLTNGFD